MSDPSSLFHRVSGDDERTPQPDGLRRRFQELADATGIGWRAAVGGALAVGLALGALWWLSRQAPVPVDTTLPLLEPASVTTTTATPAPVIVHVAGSVVHPDVHELPAGSRVVDAIEASGGLLADADVSRVNLAALVVDGTQIYVPAVGEAPPPGTGSAGGADADSGPIDINVATAAQLESLPGIGPATASAIVEHRERNGPFASVEGLLDVRGIGEAKLAQLRDLVRV